MSFNFSSASRKKLEGVHPDMVRVAERAIQLTEVDFKITCGTRTVAEQRKLLAAGATTTMKSRHIPGTNKSGMSEAVDVQPLVGGKGRWDWPLFYKLADAFKDAAEELRIPIQWGGDWKSFKDGPHFELKR